MSVSKKNKNLFRLQLPLDMLDDHEANPNEMTERAFDLLVENVDEAGFTDPMLVWPRGKSEVFLQVMKDVKSAGIKLTLEEPIPEVIEMLKAAGVRFTFVGGHHRRDALQYLGETFGPCTIIGDPEFDEDAAEAQLMRNNLIHGKVDPVKFGKMLERQYAKGLPDDVIQSMYGFSEDAEFEKLKNQLASQLPTKDAQEKFKKAAEEIKTIDGLTKLLNRMFTLYGDTLPYGYMVIDYGGQSSIWMRASKKTFDAVGLIGQACLENNVTIDDVLGNVLQSIARGDAADLIQAALEKAPQVQLPQGVLAMPTKDNLTKLKGVENGG